MTSQPDKPPLPLAGAVALIIAIWAFVLIMGWLLVTWQQEHALDSRTTVLFVLVAAGSLATRLTQWLLRLTRRWT